MALNTLITIKDALTAFVEGHGQLTRVVFEADDHRAPYITEDSDFPMLFVAPISVVATQAMNVHMLRMYVYERINDDRLDVWENANDTSLILRDIRVWWNNYGEDSIQIIEDPTGDFICDRELDYLVGYYADFNFEIPSHGRCDVPVNVTPAPSNTCAAATYEITDTDLNVLHSGSIPSGGNLDQIISDTNLEVNGISEGSVLATSTVDVQLSDSGGVVTPDSVTLVGNDLQIVLPDPTASVTGAPLLKSGQTTSYRTGDDGSIQAGRDVDFFTLNYTNPFGNTNRFTDELGGQTYVNDIVIDWTTFNGSNVLGIYRILSAGNVSWITAIDASLALSVGSFTSGWRLWNSVEMLHFMYMAATVNVYNYAPLNFPIAAFWTSTTDPFNTSNAVINNYSGLISIASVNRAGGVARRATVRTFTVTGTVLT